MTSWKYGLTGCVLCRTGPSTLRDKEESRLPNGEPDKHPLEKHDIEKGKSVKSINIMWCLPLSIFPNLDRKHTTSTQIG